MKVRTGFVSNSSSSSFVIPLVCISGKQLKLIEAHRIKGPKMGLPCDENDSWGIEVTDSEIRGSTCMDNFNMDHFLSEIGVASKDITWSEWPDW